MLHCSVRSISLYYHSARYFINIKNGTIKTVRVHSEPMCVITDQFNGKRLSYLPICTRSTTRRILITFWEYLCRLPRTFYSFFMQNARRTSIETDRTLCLCSFQSPFKANRTTRELITAFLYYIYFNSNCYWPALSLSLCLPRSRIDNSRHVALFCQWVCFRCSCCTIKWVIISKM